MWRYLYSTVKFATISTVPMLKLWKDIFYSTPIEKPI